MRASTMSSTNWPRPCARRRAFGRVTERPTQLLGESKLSSFVVASKSFIGRAVRMRPLYTKAGGLSALPRRSAALLRPRDPGLRHRLDGVDDRLVAGAAAVVAREILADALAR